MVAVHACPVTRERIAMSKTQLLLRRSRRNRSTQDQPLLPCWASKRRRPRLPLARPALKKCHPSASLDAVPMVSAIKESASALKAMVDLRAPSLKEMFTLPRSRQMLMVPPRLLSKALCFGACSPSFSALWLRRLLSVLWTGRKPQPDNKPSCLLSSTMLRVLMQGSLSDCV